jgi:hypothetical protein
MNDWSERPPISIFSLYLNEELNDEVHPILAGHCSGRAFAYTGQRHRLRFGIFDLPTERQFDEDLMQLRSQRGVSGYYRELHQFFRYR